MRRVANPKHGYSAEFPTMRTETVGKHQQRFEKRLDAMIRTLPRPRWAMKK